MTFRQSNLYKFIILKYTFICDVLYNIFEYVDKCDIKFDDSLIYTQIEKEKKIAPKKMSMN